MKERLLQYIWRYQYFHRLQLYTESGEALQILSPGDLNTHQGPDFLHATIRIGNTLLVGNIELHIKTSDWERHAHQLDKNYRNVILHVVWENDVYLPGTLPLLVLQHRVPKLLLGKYEGWMNRQSFIVCEGQLSQVGEKTWEGWKKRLVQERLYRKSIFIRDALEENHQHWEEVTWWLLSRNFGLPVNTLSFEAMARSIPISVLARHRREVGQLEALLLGQAGLLEEEFGEDYPLFLQKEFRYLRQKYRLPVPSSPVLFLRMRPGNSPVLRLAQLSGLMARRDSWFVAIKEADSPEELEPLLRVSASSWWDRHYSLGATKPGAVSRSAEVGSQSGEIHAGRETGRHTRGTHAGRETGGQTGRMDAGRETGGQTGRMDTGRETGGQTGAKHAGKEVGGQAMTAGDTRERLGKRLPDAGAGNRIGVTDEGAGERWAGADEDGGVALPKRIGKQMIDSIMINTAVPLLFAYGWLRGEKAFKEKALRWLTVISPEKNALITGWGHQGVFGKQAADTQALLELKTRYCDPKKCLDCAIGHFLLGGDLG